MMNLIDLKGKTLTELEDFAKSIGESAFRGRQLFKWIYNKSESDFSKMTDIGKALREKLRSVSYVSYLKLVEKISSPNRDTEKFVFQLSDGNFIETVLMRYEEHLGFGRCTLCISSQAGCAQGCHFCASGKYGLIRNLETQEIIDQVIQCQNYLNTTDERIANVVVMGIGEPLMNYNNLIKSIHLINHGGGIAIGMRHIAVSTVGIPPLIKKLAQENLHIRFALSLHAPDDETRDKIMPINKKYPISELMEACRYYQEITDRRITFEYMLIEGLNDSKEQARQLGKLLRGIHSMVNLIPHNSIEGSPYKKPSRERCNAFAKELSRFCLKVTFRNERGVNIDAACGQLRNRIMI